ncbi:hypothetical protein KP79_PYT25197 [Mizuhopecten yessoensis]|uniref:CCHC-type domain-containing protein n=1 Tax=Mizuhopecten yessoensis TaxID=6573 RepID=A0A210PRY2_MIZYE|nr:hypothetical protein KP79_PYT25197 [Mizuhopecten yessoensis]
MVDYVTKQGLLPGNEEPVHQEDRDEGSEDDAVGVPSVQVNMTRKPWIAKFNGTDKDGYDVWRNQLLSLVEENHKDQDIMDALRSSLQGKAASVFSRINAGVPIKDILKKMDSIFGEIDSESDLLAEFYGARQRKDESVADWGCRLESVLDSIQKQCTLPHTPDMMLRNMLWTGLRQDLKDVSGYLVNQINIFDDLRIALRRIEKQHKLPASATDIPKQTSEKKSVPAKSAQEDTYKKLEAMVQQLTVDIAEMKKKSSKPLQGKEGQQGRRFDQPPNNRYNNRRGTNHYRGDNNYQQSTANNNVNRPQQYNNSNRMNPEHEEPICWRCGQSGHLQYGCRVNVNHVRRPQDF